MLNPNSGYLLENISFPAMRSESFSASPATCGNRLRRFDNAEGIGGSLQAARAFVLPILHHPIKMQRLFFLPLCFRS